MSTAAWKSCASAQVSVAKPDRDTVPLWGGVTTALGTAGTQRGGMMVALRTDEMWLGGCDGCSGGTEGTQPFSEGM